jgi:hypothetical protein
MNRNVAIVVGLILLGALIVGSYAMTPRESTGMTIVLYDENDNAVYEIATGPRPFGFGFANQQDASISKAVVRVTYTVAGSSGATGYVSVNAYEKVTTRLNTQTGNIVKTTPGNNWARIINQDTVSTTWQLSDVISPVDAAGKQYGWGVEFETRLEATATIDGQTVTSSVTLTICLLVKWVDPAVGFSITGTISVLAS